MEPSFITVNDITVALYVRPGNKRGLFMVHGNSSNAHAFEGVWSSRLLQDYHLVSIDLPGHGQSPPPKDTTQYTLSSLGRLVADIIDQLGLNDIILAGHSIGGHIVLTCLNFTDRVAGVSLAGTVPVNGAGELSQAYIISEAVQTVFKGEASRAEIEAFCLNAVHRRELAGTVARSFVETDKAFRDEMGRELSRHFSSGSFVSEVDLLKNNDMDVCLIHGAEEKVVNFSHLQSIEGLRLFQKKIHVVAGAGHSVPLEAPEEYSAILADFALQLSKPLARQ